MEEEGEVVGARLDADGVVRHVMDSGHRERLAAALLDGNRRRLRRNGASDVVDACLQGIHQKLIEPSSRAHPGVELDAR